MSGRRKQVIDFGHWVVETALLFGASPNVAFAAAGELVRGLLEEDREIGPGPHHRLIEGDGG